MNTTENNKIIAEFMGMKPINKNDTDGIWNCTIKAHGFNIVQNLSFNSDWNWLMEVVEKIENLGFEFFIVESRCEIAHNTDKSIETVIGFEIVGKKIEATYNACIEFIKWYNQNK